MKEQLFIVILLLVLGQAYYQLPLEGGIIQKEYIVKVYVGNPPQQFKVMIDTGSGRLAINCKGCTNCGIHPNNPFDINKSSSATVTTCSQPRYCINCEGGSPATNRCESLLKYQDNSSNEGYVFTDRVSLYFDGTTSAFSRINCITSMSSQFSSDKLIDGIWGLAKNDIDVDNQQFRSDEYIVELSSHLGVNRTLAICLGYEGGIMVFGGVDAAMHTRPPIVVPYDSPSADTISKSISEMKIGDTVIYSNAGQAMPDIIIDSGSTTSVLDRKTYNTISTAIEATCASMNDQECFLDTQTSGQSICVDLSNPGLIHHFPTISITIAGEPVRWQPETYLLLQNKNYPSYFCFDIMVSDTGLGSLLGADFMIGNNIVFGQANIQIYPKSYCGGRNFQQVVRSLLISDSKVLNRKISSSKTLIIMMAIVVPLAMIAAIAVYCFWKRLRAKSEMKEELKIEGEAVIMGTPTDIRLKADKQAVNSL